MSFLIAQPAALTAAAGVLEGVSSALASQNLAAALPTTGVIPAAADQVSALQATQFSAYGMLYQQISAQAAAIHQQIVSTLTGNAGSYGTTEGMNAAGLPLLGMLTGSSSGGSGYNMLTSALGNGGVFLATQAGNFASAVSDLDQLGEAGFISGTTPEELVNAESPMPAEAAPAGAVSPAAPAATVAAAGPASAGPANGVGRLSVPPSWAAQAGVQANPAAALTGATATAAEGAPLAGVPAGLPGGAGQDHSGVKTTKYAVKAKLMAPPPAV